MSDDAAVPDAVSLADDESVLWTGRPRLSAAIPAGVVGVLFVAGGVAAAVAGQPDAAFIVGGLLLALVGVAVPAGALLSLTNTRYVVTDRAAYVKTGVVGRSVARARLATVQNSAYSQSLTGSLFGYGTVDLQTAGGSFAFRRVDDPRDVRTRIDRRIGGDDDLPGTASQWRAVLEETAALRRALEQ
ncbi:PH domain-containing protein [Halobaculum sp. D14]|uniref:PH domain-containing protein n=1 Tax=Halobaculum sp. D14 TaxID=3421642 RepID=UPI003EC0B67A